MPLTVKIPTGKEKKEYSLYVSGKVIYKYTEPEYGTLLRIEGGAVAFYSASNSRRAIIFHEDMEKKIIPLEYGNLPYIKQKVQIIYRAKGRKIDLLKFLCYTLEEKYGKIPYELGISYWLLIGSYIDSHKKTNNDLIFKLTNKYIERRNKINGNQ